ncbi:MAG: TldD/PmbA family protein [Spirochaetia bacterium]
MIKLEHSKYLESKSEVITALIDSIEKEYSSVSVLGADSYGMKYQVSSYGVTAEPSMWSERGFVLRALQDGRVFEYSFNAISKDTLEDTAEKILDDFKELGEVSQDPIEFQDYTVPYSDIDYQGSCELLPADIAPSEILEKLTALHDSAKRSKEEIVNAKVVFEGLSVSKFFYTKKGTMKQSYPWCQSAVFVIAKRGDVPRYSYKTFAGRKGPEILEEVGDAVSHIAAEAVELLDAVSPEPGEYDVICNPGIAGTIAHESFGHGVELDMFLRGRAKAGKYFGKPVASGLVSITDSPTAVDQTGSYSFDDEGTPAGSTAIIEKGIFISGIGDMLSASALNMQSTGNGRRESYKRKAYSRMTNTFIEPGNDTLDEMIASVKKGYLIEGLRSGMEDPKNWGIQLIALLGKEIIDGKLTGKLVTPVLLTGFVPDVLGAVSMVSDSAEFYGFGYCGKGYKELVKVSAGAPYIKTRMRIG